MMEEQLMIGAMMIVLVTSLLLEWVMERCSLRSKNLHGKCSEDEQNRCQRSSHVYTILEHTTSLPDSEQTAHRKQRFISHVS